jgi:hypothetical protein
MSTQVDGKKPLAEDLSVIVDLLNKREQFLHSETFIALMRGDVLKK